MKSPETNISRGHKKRKRTRAQLIEAGAAVLAEKGEAFTVSDVVSRAEVSSGTFYNYFADRRKLIAALVEFALEPIAAPPSSDSAAAESAKDARFRYALIGASVLERAVTDPTWARVLLRLFDAQNVVSKTIRDRLIGDLTAGHDEGHFTYGGDDVTVDMVLGFVLASIRRLASGNADSDQIEPILERSLIIVGVPTRQARALTSRALAEIAE